MRQRGDPLFIDILNAARVGDLSDRDIEILSSKKRDIENVSADATVIFADIWKYLPERLLDNLSETYLEIFAIDKIQEGTHSALIENINAISQSSTDPKQFWTWNGVLLSSHGVQSLTCAILVQTNFFSS